MSEWVGSLPVLPSPPLLTPWCDECIGSDLRMTGSGIQGVAAAAYPVANRVLAFPFTLSRRFVGANWFWVNGATLGGNVDAGVYDRTWALLAHCGSTAQVGAGATQMVAAAVALNPGDYYLAFVCDSAVATFQRGAPNAATVILAGALMQGSVVPLPNPFVPVISSQGYVPLFGLTTRSFL